MRVVPIAGQAAAGFHRLGAACENRDAIPALLTVPDRTVVRGADCGRGKFLIGRLQFLQTNDVRRGLREPWEYTAAALVGKKCFGDVDALADVGVKEEDHRQSASVSHFLLLKTSVLYRIVVQISRASG
jgi:hypothetical protein